jgi:hypothetical protein
MDEREEAMRAVYDVIQGPTVLMVHFSDHKPDMQDEMPDHSIGPFRMVEVQGGDGDQPILRGYDLNGDPDYENDDGDPFMIIAEF